MGWGWDHSAMGVAPCSSDLWSRPHGGGKEEYRAGPDRVCSHLVGGPTSTKNIGEEWFSTTKLERNIQF